MHGGLDIADADPTPLPLGLIYTTPTDPSGDTAATSVVGAVPALHSNPNATVKLYLDFDGAAAATWGSYSVTATPAYSQDADASTFTSTELASIQQIWARVSEKYSPFNIDVTTVDPGTYADRVALHAVIGGGGAWTGVSCGGISYVGAFANSSPNTSYIFSDNLGMGAAKYVAEAIAHEAGHAFGLQHQSTYSATGALTNSYNPGTSVIAPIMGTSYYATRGLWWYGTSSSANTMQDDLAILSGSNNAFGYRTDDHGNTAELADALAVSGSSISGAGIIEKMTDSDVFSFSTAGGSFSLAANVAQYGAMLDLKLELRAADGTLITSANTASLGESISATLPAGTYYVFVSSAGNYGDIGQYTLSGSVAPVVTPPPVTVAAPSSLAASLGTNNLVTLSWADNSSNEDGFVVQSSTNGGSTWSDLGIMGINVTSWQGVDSTIGTTLYRVYAFSGSVNSDFSTTASIIIAPPPVTVTAPSGLNASLGANNQVTLNWADNSTNEDGFTIQSSTDGGSNWSNIGAVGVNVTSWQGVDSFVGTTIYRVQGFSASVTSAYSNSASVTIPVTVTAPSNLSANLGANNLVTLTWSDNSANEDGFYIQSSTDGGSNWTTIGTSGANATSWQLLDSFVGTTTYRVQGFAGSVTSAYSNSSVVTIPVTVTAPSNLSANLGANNLVTLTWTDNSANEDGFIIQSSTNGGLSWSDLASTNANVASWQRVDFTIGTTLYRVYGFCGLVNSSFSSTAGVTIAPPPVTVATPTGLNASLGNNNLVTLTWADNSANEDGFTIQSSTNGGSTWTTIGTSGANVTSWQLVDSFVGTTTYRVQGFAGSVASAYSNSASVIVPLTVTAPSNLSANLAANNLVTVTWADNSSNEDGFKVQTSTNGGLSWSDLATTNANIKSWQGIDSTVGTTLYRVYAFSGSVNSSYSTSASIVIAPPPVTVTAPSGLNASLGTNNQVTLTWADNSSNEDGFTIQASTNGGSSWNTIGTAGVNVTSWQLVDSFVGTTSYRVRGFTGSVISTWSNTTSVTIVPPPITVTAPSNLSANLGSNNLVTLTWTDNSSNEAGFKIQSSTNGGLSWSDLSTTSSNVTSWQGVDSTVGTTLYRVEGFAGSVMSSFSNSASVTVVPPLPTTPGGLVASAISGSQINLAWNAVTSATGYAVQRSSDGINWTLLANTTGTSFSNTGLSAGTTYYYRVLASNAYGSSSPGNIVLAKTMSLNLAVLGTPPAAPTSLVTSIQNKNHVRLTWKDNANNESGFRVQRSLDGVNWTLLATVGANTTSYTSGALSRGTYAFRVCAYNSNGDSAYAMTSPVALASNTKTALAQSPFSAAPIYWSSMGSVFGPVREVMAK
jgi:hypothetical protein